MTSRRLQPIQLAKISEYRSELYGGFAIWILLFHLQQWGIFTHLTRGRYIAYAIGHFLTLGSMGVDAFFVLSGISQYFAVKKKGQLSLSMLQGAFQGFSPQLFCILLFGGIWIYELVRSSDIPQFVVWVTGISLWFEGNKTGAWYVSVIIFLYFFYQYIYSWLFDGKPSNWIIVTRCTVLVLLALACFWAMHKLNPDYFKMVEIALGRVPSFLIGCLLGKWVYERKEISGR